MNPMIRKELKQRMRDRRGGLVPTVYLLALGGAVGLGYFVMTTEWGGVIPTEERQGAEIGSVVFATVAFTQMALLLLLAPVFSAGALTIEKEQRTLPGLLTSLLSPAQIWWGKFVSSILFLTLLLFTGVPVLSLAFALGGVGPAEVARATGVTLFMLGWLCTVGLYFSSVFRRSVHATASTYGVVIALTVLSLVVSMVLAMSWKTSHPGYDEGQPPWYIEAVMYLNPFFPLTSLWGEFDKRPVPGWLISMDLFAAMSCLTTAFALRNIRRGGEQV